MLGVDDLRRRGQTGLYGYSSHSKRSRTKEFYKLETNDADSIHKPIEDFQRTSPHQRTRDELYSIRMQTDLTITSESHNPQAGWDEGSQHSPSRIIEAAARILAGPGAGV